LKPSRRSTPKEQGHPCAAAASGRRRRHRRRRGSAAAARARTPGRGVPRRGTPACGRSRARRAGTRRGSFLPSSPCGGTGARTCAMSAGLISHQPVVLFSQNKSATSNQYFSLGINHHQRSAPGQTKSPGVRHTWHLPILATPSRHREHTTCPTGHCVRACKHTQLANNFNWVVDGSDRFESFQHQL
jgi:hypothetical protein